MKDGERLVWIEGAIEHAALSPDGEWVAWLTDEALLAFGDRQRIRIYDTSDAMELRLTLYPLVDGGWFASNPAGAVDGSPTAAFNAMTIVVGTNDDVLVHFGTLAWDRFAVDGLVSLVRQGYAITAPMAARPRAARARRDP